MSRIRPPLQETRSEVGDSESDFQRCHGPLSLLSHLFAAILIVCIAEPRAFAASEPQAGQNDLQSDYEGFLRILKKKPEFGRPFFFVVAYHTDRSSLEPFIRSLHDAATASPEDPQRWLLAGLFSLEAGDTTAAVHAFEAAERLQPSALTPTWFLSIAKLRANQAGQATTVLERAFLKSSDRNTSAGIANRLTLLYQHQNATEKILEVWKALASRFPDDSRFQERLTFLLASHGDTEGALECITRQTDRITDPLQKHLSSLRSAQLKVRAGRSAEALKDLADQRNSLLPGSWLSREISSRIDRVIIQADGVDGLIRHYRERLSAGVQDVATIEVPAKLLLAVGRPEEAADWYKNGISLFPDAVTLAASLVDLLEDQGDIAGAIKQCEVLLNRNPRNPEIIERLGGLILQNPDHPLQKRNQDAAAVWRRMLGGNDTSAATLARVARLLLQAGETDEAVSLCRRAVLLEPENSDLRIALGEFLMMSNRPVEAIDEWKRTAEGHRRTPENLRLLAQTLKKVGRHREAESVLSELCTVSKDSADLLMFTDLLKKREAYDEALEALDQFLHSSDESAARDLTAVRIQMLLASDRLETETIRLAQELESSPSSKAADWQLLSGYQKELGQTENSLISMQRALEFEPPSVSVLEDAVRLYTETGRWNECIEVLRIIAATDSQRRGNILRQIAQCWLQLSDYDQAIAVAAELTASGPEDIDSHRFHLQLCLKASRPEQAVSALRTELQQSPENAELRFLLASLLGDLFRTDDAIRNFWLIYESPSGESIDESVMDHLTRLYLRSGRFDQLITRLQSADINGSQTDRTQRNLARAYRFAGDLPTAVSELHRLLEIAAPDSDTLNQLESIATEIGDLHELAQTLALAQELNPDEDTEQRLSSVLSRIGDDQTLLNRCLRSTAPGPHRACIQAIDRLITHGQTEAAGRLCQAASTIFPDSYDAQLRMAVLLLKAEKSAEAISYFHRICNLKPRSIQTETLYGHPVKTAPSEIHPGRSLNSAASIFFRERIRANTEGQSLYSECLRFITDKSASDSNVSPFSRLQSLQAAQSAALRFLLQAERQLHQSRRFVEWYNTTFAEPTTANISLHWLLFDALQDDDITAAEWLSAPATTEIAARYTDPRGLLLCLKLINAREKFADRLPGFALSSTPLPISTTDSRLRMASFAKLFAAFPEWLSPDLKRPDIDLLLHDHEHQPELQQLPEAALQRDNPDAADMALLFAVAGEQPDLTKKLLSHRYGLSGSHCRTSMLQPQISPAFDEALLWMVRQCAEQSRPEELTSLIESLCSRCSLPRIPSAELRSAADLEFLTMLRENGQLAEVRRWCANGKPNESPGCRLTRLNLAWQTEAIDGNAGLSANRRIKFMLEFGADIASLRELAVQLSELNHLDAALNLLSAAAAAENISSEQLQQLKQDILRIALQGGDQQQARSALRYLLANGESLDALQRKFPQLSEFGITAKTHHRKPAAAVTQNIDIHATWLSLASLQERLQVADDVSKSSVAAEAAYELLYRTQGLPSTADRSQPSASTPEMRRQPLLLLHRQGRLKELVERTRNCLQAPNLQRQPRLMSLLNLLAEYCTISEDDETLSEIRRRIETLTASDPLLQLQHAARQELLGDKHGACDSYLQVLKKWPDIFVRDFETHLQSFEHAKRLPDLMNTLLSADLTSFASDSRILIRLAAEMNQAAEHRDNSAQLMRRVFDAFPEQQTETLKLITMTNGLTAEERLIFVLQALEPDPAVVRQNIWYGLEDKELISLLTQHIGTPALRTTACNHLQPAVTNTADWSGGLLLLKALQLITAILAEDPVPSPDSKAAAGEKYAEEIGRLLSETACPITPDAAVSVSQLLAIAGDDSRTARTAMMKLAKKDQRHTDGTETLQTEWLTELTQLCGDSLTRNQIRSMAASLLRLSPRAATGQRELGPDRVVPLTFPVLIEHHDGQRMPVDALRIIALNAQARRWWQNPAERSELDQWSDAMRRISDATERNDIASWLHDCRNIPDSVSADAMLDLLPTILFHSTPGSDSHRSPEILRCRSLMLELLANPAAATDAPGKLDSGMIVQNVREILAQEHSDVRLIMMSIAAVSKGSKDKSPADHELLSALMNQLMKALEDADKREAAAAVFDSRPSGRTSAVRRDLACATLADLLPRSESWRKTADQLLNRSVRAAAVSGDDLLLISVLQTCSEVTISFSTSETTNRFSEQAKELIAAEISRRNPDQSQLDLQVSAWLATRPRFRPVP